MSEDADVEPAVSSADKASPWPLFVALGLAVGEVGVFMGLYPVAVAGLLLFVGSVAGIVTEAGYTEAPWRLLGGLGVVLVALGIWVVSTQIAAGSVDAWVAAVAADDTIVLRGFSIAAAGVIALAASGAGAVVQPDLVGANQ
jgi:hypothetical protein